MAEKKKDDVLEKLDHVSRLLALLVTKGESKQDSVEMLDGIGFKSTEIAHLLGLKPNVVTATLSNIKKKKKVNKKQ